MNSHRQFFILLSVAMVAVLTVVFVYQQQTVEDRNSLPVLGAEDTRTAKGQKFIDLSPKVSPTAFPSMSMDSLFQYHDPTVTSYLHDSNTFTLLATGDVIPARSVNAATVSLNDFTYPFASTSAFLRQSDAVFVNLESPLISLCAVTIEGMKFCGDERHIEGLKYANVSVVSIANNHMGNYGVEGIVNTITLLKKQDIAVTGNGEAAIFRKNGFTVGFLGYNDIGAKEEGIAWADPVQIRNDITKLKPSVDFVIVAFHWGTEYVSDPTTYQRQLAYEAIDAGADLIIGNHPHWVQGTEKYKEKFITYAHGNFVFDQMWSQETREGVIGKYVFTHQGLQQVTFYPVIIENYVRPRFARQSEAAAILNRMKISSEKLLLPLN